MCLHFPDSSISNLRSPGWIGIIAESGSEGGHENENECDGIKWDRQPMVILRQSRLNR